MRNQELLRLLKCRYRLLSRHTGEILEKVREGMAALYVVEESLEWDPRSYEDGLAAQDLWIGVYYAVSV